MMIGIEVAYALPEEQVVIPLRVEPPITISEAISRSGILERFPDIEPADNRVGVFGNYRPLSHPLEDGDRVEIYRPLHASPTDARRMRAEARRRRRKP
jgi:putative ubiquitin-RnfH superfamily antitoxin RatB of RatAB toxin-antitoxin module